MFIVRIVLIAFLGLIAGAILGMGVQDDSYRLFPRFVICLVIVTCLVNRVVIETIGGVQTAQICFLVIFALGGFLNKRIEEAWRSLLRFLLGLIHHPS